MHHKFVTLNDKNHFQTVKVKDIEIDYPGSPLEPSLISWFLKSGESFLGIVRERDGTLGSQGIAMLLILKMEGSISQGMQTASKKLEKARKILH